MSRVLDRALAIAATDAPAAKPVYVPSHARKLTRRGILGYLDVSLSGAGLIGGGKLAARLEEIFGETQIETLPARFATITTEVGTGHEIWLTRGRLVDALRCAGDRRMQRHQIFGDDRVHARHTASTLLPSGSVRNAA